ncbi:MAG: serine dehydratase subunit alpha family protein [Anaeroplasmataceae bacterium]
MKYDNEYIKILQEELKPAMGCTEPIAIAYASSVAKKYLNDEIESIEVFVSGNIVKNVKSVVVPNTNGLRGIEAAVAIGVCAGDSNKELECISNVTDEQILECQKLLDKKIINVSLSNSDYIFDINIIMHGNNNISEVRIIDFHTNIVLIKQNENIILQKEEKGKKKTELTDRTLLNVNDIYEFIEQIDVDILKNILHNQINYNMAIANEGLKNPYGANIGKTILASEGDSIKTKAKAYAAAGSDARMNGCNMPVVINSGSGNQGMTCSIPVIIYSRELNASEEKMLRALALSNLLTIHIKTDIGRLSAYCGAIAAGCAAGAAIAYLQGGGLKEINHTLVNALAITSGIICDGAKASCAAKIAIAVDAGILGYHMYLNGNQFKAGDGIVKKGVENTIHNVGKLASEGMVETDKEILKIMMN